MGRMETIVILVYILFIFIIIYLYTYDLHNLQKSFVKL